MMGQGGWFKGRQFSGEVILWAGRWYLQFGTIPMHDLAEKRGDHMVLIVLHPANTATAWAGRPPNGVIPDLCRDNLMLEASQQPLRFGQA